MLTTDTSLFSRFYVPRIQKYNNIYMVFHLKKSKLGVYLFSNPVYHNSMYDNKNLAGT